jgi:hypothetical protein
MTATHSHPHPPFGKKQRSNIDILFPLRRFVDDLQIHNAKFARLIATVIPCCCPFERDINLFGRTLFHIPSLCKLNPLYDELIALRFRALSYLADDRGEDISRYIC